MSLSDDSAHDDRGHEIRTQVGPWAMVPVWVLGLGLTGAELAVYVSLRSFADRGGDAHPKIRTVAARAGVSERTAERALARLRDLDAVRSEQVKVGGEIKGCRFWLRDTPPAVSPPPDEPVATPPTGMTPPPDEHVGTGTHQGTHQGTPSAATQRRAERADDTTGDALPGMPTPPGPEEGVRPVVAAFVEEWIAAGRDYRPPGQVIGQVGREAKRLITDGSVPMPVILDAARSAGRQGWRSIEAEVGRLNAPPPTRGGRIVTNRHEASAADRQEPAPW